MHLTYKVALLLTRRAGISSRDFTRSWLEASLPLSAAGLRSQCYNEAADMAARIENAPPAEFDGVVELEFDSAEHAHATIGSAASRDSWLGPRLDLLDAPVSIVSGYTHRIYGAPGSEGIGGVKVLTLPVRRAGMTMADFAHHWLVVHSGLALAGPDARAHLAELASTPADHCAFDGLATARFDGIGVIRFVSPAAMAAEFAGEHYRSVMAQDEPRFTDPTGSRAMPVLEVSRLTS